MKAWMLAAGLVAAAATGCGRARVDDHGDAMNRARQQAALTGVAQSVVWQEKDGSTVTTTVQPPKPGDPEEEITRSVAR